MPALVLIFKLVHLACALLNCVANLLFRHRISSHEQHVNYCVELIVENCVFLGCHAKRDKSMSPQNIHSRTEILSSRCRR